MKLKNAFSVAEVLITLLIIGTVAALTIPNLIQSYKKSVVETRLAKFYSTINQAILMSEVENGSRMTWDLMENLNVTQVVSEGKTAQEWYKKYLAKYITPLKTENSQTVERKYNLYFTDGSMVTFSGSSWLYYPYAKDYKEHLVSNGADGNETYIDRDRSGSGTKYFTFIFMPTKIDNRWLYQKGVEPYLNKEFDGQTETLVSNNIYGCKKDIVSNERAYCTELIKRNGWKIPKDYPFKF